MADPTTFAPPLDPVADLVACQSAVRRAGWWQQSGLPERWPLSTDDALHMLTAAGYEIDPAAVSDLIDRRLLPRPGVGEVDYEWGAVDVCHLAGLLDARRQWLPTPCVQDAKKAECELALERARAAGELAFALGNAGPRFDVRQLLELLVESQVHEGRRKIATLLRAVLEHEHDVLI